MLISRFNPLLSSFSTDFLPRQKALDATLDPLHHVLNTFPMIPYLNVCSIMIPPKSLQFNCSIRPVLMHFSIPFSAKESSKPTLNGDSSNVLFLLSQFLLQNNFETNIVYVSEYLLLLSITNEYSICLVVFCNQCSLLLRLVGVRTQTTGSSLLPNQHLPF